MTDKEIIIDGANTLKEKINMCFILLLNKLETTETIERTIYEHLDAFVDEWNDLFQRKEQECKELKETLIEIKEILEIHKDNKCAICPKFDECFEHPSCDNIILQKISECDELKEELARIEEDLKYQCVDCMNIKSDRYRKALEEIGKIVKINCEEICGRKFEDCNDFLCSSKNILDIINKAKGKNPDEN